MLTLGIGPNFSDLTGALFEKDLNVSVNGFRQNLQIEYINRLAKIIDYKQNSEYSNMAISHVFAQVKRIENLIKSNPGKDDSTKAHRQYLLHLIKIVLNPNVN